MAITEELEKYLNEQFPIPEILTKPISTITLKEFVNLNDTPNNKVPYRIKPDFEDKTENKKNLKESSTASFILEGTLISGNKTRYAIHGKDIRITSNTWIFGDLELGSRVKAKGVVANDERICTSLVVYSKI